jgi:hypothetical protein
VEGLKATDPRHRPFNPEMVPLDALLQYRNYVVSLEIVLFDTLH